MSSTGLQRGQMYREATRRLFICVYSVLCRFMLPSATEELCFPEIGFPPVIPRDSGDSWGVPGAGACSLHSGTQPFSPTVPSSAALPGLTVAGPPGLQSAQAGGLISVRHPGFFLKMRWASLYLCTTEPSFKSLFITSQQGLLCKQL